MLIRAALASLVCAGSLAAATTIVTVVGAGGEEPYDKQFAEWAEAWKRAGHQAGAGLVEIGRDAGGTNDLTAFHDALAAASKDGLDPLWLVLIGHGTFDGKEAKFNLRGPDFSAAELGKWLEPFRRPLVIINAASASAPFLNTLSRSNRIVVTATRSGYEQNFARLGKYLSGAVADPEADLDKDGQTSLLEAFLTASRATSEFYSGEGRLATEHSLIDDNGDGFGTQADWFRGVRAVKKPEKGAAIDGVRAHQVHLVPNEADKQLPVELKTRRNELELSISKLRDSKAQMAEEEYYARLEPLLIEMARLYETTTP